MASPIAKKFDILNDSFVTNPSEAAGKNLSGPVSLDRNNNLTFSDEAGNALVQISMRRTGTLNPEALEKLAGTVCQTRFEPRKGWFKYGGSPYTRLHISVLHLQPVPSTSRTHEENSHTVQLGDNCKRGPSDYYQEHYQNCRELAITLGTVSSEEEAQAAYDKLDPTTLQLVKAGSEENRIPKYNCTIDGIGEDYFRTVPQDLVELLGLGYTASFAIEIRANEPTKRFGPKRYSVIAVPSLRRRTELGGIEVVPSSLFPKKEAEIIHRSIVELCADGTLLPSEALAAELVALGCRRKVLAHNMGWDDDETKRHILSAYGKLGVTSRDSLRVKIGVDTASPTHPRAKTSQAKPEATTPRESQAKTPQKENTPRPYKTSFTFEIAGTAYHLRGANLLEDGNVASLSVRREPNNEYDENAIAIRVNGRKAGYVPADEAEELAELLDNGYVIEFTRLSTSSYYKKKRRKVNLGGGDYFYEYDYDYDRPIPTATVSLVCTRPTVALTTNSAKGPSTSMSDSAIHTSSDGTHHIAIGDFIVRSHGYSCSHKGHEMTPVEASVTILVANSFLTERKFRAFYCEQCGMYFVTDTTFERITRSGRLCCRVIALEEVVNPKTGSGRFSDFAPESLIHQYGYNVSKTDDLSSASRQAILSFIIENGIMNQYEIITFLEGLIRTRSGMRNMRDAISKWRQDVVFLERYRPPKQSLRVAAIYARRSVLK